MAKVRIMETAIRDGHQSLLATRMRTEDMIPALEQMDAIGYHSIECWGCATFDSALRFLREDHWERLREKYHALQFSDRARNNFRNNIVNRELMAQDDDAFPSVRCFDAALEFLGTNRDADGRFPWDPGSRGEEGAQPRPGTWRA